MTATESKRRYDNTRRREQAEQTRERIVSAGADLLRASSVRDWNAVTIRAVAERAGVNERTVYRHFDNERALRDALMHRLEHDVGVNLDDMHLEDIAPSTARVFRHVSSYRMSPRPPLDPTLRQTLRRQHDALLHAVEAHTKDWSPADRTLAAATFDVLWSIGAFERLVLDWHLDREDAIRAMTWVIGLVEDALRDGRRPPKPARKKQ